MIRSISEIFYQPWGLCLLRGEKNPRKRCIGRCSSKKEEKTRTCEQPNQLEQDSGKPNPISQDRDLMLYLSRKEPTKIIYMMLSQLRICTNYKDSLDNGIHSFSREPQFQLYLGRIIQTRHKDFKNCPFSLCLYAIFLTKYILGALKIFKNVLSIFQPFRNLKYKFWS